MRKNLLIYGTSDHVGDLLKRHFNVFTQSEIIYRNGDYDTNFNIVLNVDGADSKQLQEIETFCKIANIPHLGTPRYPKSIQHIILRSQKIVTPDTYYINSNRVSDFALINLLLRIPDDHKIIAKYENGARGVGQMLLTKKQLVDFALNGFSFTDRGNYNEEDEYKVFSGDTKNIAPAADSDIKINTSSYIIPQISSGNAIFQKYVPIKREYRYLYFYGEIPIIIERTRNEGDWQANSCITGNGRVISGDEHKQFGDLHTKISNLAKHLNAPFLSVDVYVDEDDVFGVLEFQMEFGIKYVPHQELITKITNSIKNKIK